MQNPLKQCFPSHDLHANDDRDLPAIRGLSLELRAGEILGVAGVQGNGQTELVEVITGLRPALAGELSNMQGKTITNATPRTVVLIQALRMCRKIARKMVWSRVSHN